MFSQVYILNFSNHNYLFILFIGFSKAVAKYDCSDLVDYSHIYKLWEIFKDLCIITKYKGLDKRILYYQGIRNEVFFTSEMRLDLNIFNILRHFEIWQPRVRKRIVKIENLFRKQCKLSDDYIDKIFNLFPSKF